MRRIVPFKDAEYELQANLAGGFIKNLSPTPLRVNDAFYLHNFKGIKNLGYHFDDSGDSRNKKGLAGDVLGFDKFLTAGAKLTHNECPILSAWNIYPFIFANAALAPNRSLPLNPEAG